MQGGKNQKANRRYESMNSNFNPGKFFILGFDAVRPEGDFLHLIENYPPAGFLLMQQNYEDPEQLKSLVSYLKSIVDDDVLFAVDQEPGRVQRFKKGFPRSKLPSEYLKDNSVDQYRVWCSGTASILAEVGINLNLAPEMDLASKASESPVLNGRSFGGDSERVTGFARILVEEHRDKGVLTCAKHFPGLGAGEFDPHEKISISREPLRRFENYHWHPFRAAVGFSVSMVMTTHLLAPSLDNENCATYSRRIISHLRKDIGHTGPVISDDLYMKGAGGQDLLDQSSIKSIQAGHNLVIISRDINLQRKAIERVSSLVEQDEAFRQAAMENERIIEELKNKIRS